MSARIQLPDRRRRFGATAALLAVVLATAAFSAVGSPVLAGESRHEAGAAATSGGFGIQLLDAPVSAKDDPRAARYIVDHLSPGSTIQRRVLVVNSSDQPLLIDLYPAAATIVAEHFSFEPDRTTNELTGWVTLATDRVELAAGTSREVLTTIAVPADASRGERYGVIWASVTSGSDAAESSTAESTAAAATGRVVMANRVGVRMYLDIGAGGAPITGFEIGEFTAGRSADGAPELSMAITNTGERALDMTGSVALTGGPGGSSAGPFPITGGTTLAPGDVGSVSVELPPDLPNGPWTATAKLASGTVTNTAAAQVTFPESGQVVVAAAGESQSWWMVGGLIVGLALVVLAVVVLLAARARGDRRVAQS